MAGHASTNRMTDTDLHNSAETLWQHWQQSRRLSQLPTRGRPATRAEGYAIQRRVAHLSGQEVVGWKIAATSQAGQAHIHVDGPIGGRLLEKRVLQNGATVSLAGNVMCVVEAEFVFRMGRDLTPRDQPLEVDDVLAAVDGLHVGIEIPDSRYEEVTVVGAPQLIADNACACWFVLGGEVAVDWRAMDLVAHPVYGYKNGTPRVTGSGGNVLGDPRVALTWMANELREVGETLRAGQFVTTGTCIVPIPVAPGDSVRMDFGVFGSVEVRFTDVSPMTD
jgi:2-keto-4-pentenoate hydratase